MSPEDLPLPKSVQDALYCLLGEGWDNQADAIVAYIDSKARQIEALKEDLLTDRAELILYSPQFSLWRYLHHVNEIRDQDDLKPITEEARRQLAAEHPDLFWPEDKPVTPAGIVLTDERQEARP